MSVTSLACAMVNPGTLVKPWVMSMKRVGLEAGPLSQWLYSVLAVKPAPVRQDGAIFKYFSDHEICDEEVGGSTEGCRSKRVV
jgi:hypothetical protein